MSLIKFKDNDVILNPSYQMSDAYASQHVPENYQYKWQEKYWKKVFEHRGFDLPMPVMVRNKPYWGGVFPPEHIELKEGKRYVANFKMKIFSVDEKQVRLPNDVEYEHYFKHHINAGTFKLVKIKNSHCGVILRHR